MKIEYKDVNRQKFVDELLEGSVDFANIRINALDDSEIGAIVTIFSDDKLLKLKIDEIAEMHNPDIEHIVEPSEIERIEQLELENKELITTLEFLLLELIPSITVE